MTLLRASGLTAGYGQVTVLHGIDLEVAEGEIVVMLGANGAGKTTTMRSISGTIGREGVLEFAGDDITSTSPDSIVRMGVAQVPQGRGTFPELSVDDNLRAGAITRRDSSGVAADMRRWYEQFPRLAERRTQRAGSLSGGEQQMLAIGRALMGDPRFLMLDEPSLGIAPRLISTIFEKIVEINRSHGITILLVEQNANLALEVSSRAYVLETGRIVMQGDSRTLRDDPRLRATYLGG
mgnify:CR=1 FL=1